VNAPHDALDLPLDGIRAENLFARLVHDKKTVQGKVHFVLPDRIGHVRILSGIAEPAIRAAIVRALDARSAVAG